MSSDKQLSHSLNFLQDPYRQLGKSCPFIRSNMEESPVMNQLEEREEKYVGVMNGPASE